VVLVVDDHGAVNLVSGDASVQAVGKFQGIRVLSPSIFFEHYVCTLTGWNRQARLSTG
jgi:hypothetical protein